MSSKTFDRSKYGATNVETLKKQEQEVKAQTSFGGERIEFLKLKKGKNKIRIFPKHDETPSYCYARTIHFLELEKTDKDGVVVKDDNGKVTYSRKPVFNAKVHGTFPAKTPKIDVIDEYVQRVYAKAHELFKDDAQRKKYLSIMTFWKTGITAKTKWVVYANVYDDNGVPQFGRLEMPTTVKDKLNEIAANQDDPTKEPFTCADTGRAVFVTYNPDEQDAKKKYTAAIDFQKETPLTDDELRVWLECDALEKMFVGAYQNKDFNNAMEGLKRFDNQSVFALRALGFDDGYNIFADETYLDICENVAEYFPAEFKDAGSPNSFIDNVPDDAPFEGTTGTVDITKMDLDQLSQYIHTNGLEITILPEDTTEDIVQAIQDEEAELNDTDKVEEEAPTRKRRTANRSTDLD